MGHMGFLPFRGLRLLRSSTSHLFSFLFFPCSHRPNVPCRVKYRAQRRAVPEGGAAPQGRGGCQEEDGGGGRPQKGTPQGDRQKSQRSQLEGVVCIRVIFSVLACRQERRQQEDGTNATTCPMTVLVAKRQIVGEGRGLAWLPVTHASWK